MEASKQLSKCQIFSSGVSLDIKPLLTCPASEQMPPQPISPFCGSTIQSLLMLLPPPPRDQGQDHSTSAGMRHVSILLSQAAALRGSQRPLRRGDRWFLLSAESSAAQQRADSPPGGSPGGGCVPSHAPDLHPSEGDGGTAALNCFSQARRNRWNDSKLLRFTIDSEDEACVISIWIEKAFDKVHVQEAALCLHAKSSVRYERWVAYQLNLPQSFPSHPLSLCSSAGPVKSQQ